jgi:hypothetical protein
MFSVVAQRLKQESLLGTAVYQNQTLKEIKQIFVNSGLRPETDANTAQVNNL